MELKISVPYRMILAELFSDLENQCVHLSLLASLFFWVEHVFNVQCFYLVSSGNETQIAWGGELFKDSHGAAGFSSVPRAVMRRPDKTMGGINGHRNTGGCGN